MSDYFYCLGALVQIGMLASSTAFYERCDVDYLIRLLEVENNQ